jgi:hypothetical protein
MSRRKASACSGGSSNPNPNPDPDPDTLDLSGTYNGVFAIYNTSIIGNTTFAIAADGKVTGTTSTSSGVRTSTLNSDHLHATGVLPTWVGES